MMTETEATLLARATRSLEQSDAVAASYDRDSDTLMLHVFGQPRAAISIPIESSDDGMYIRLDPIADQIVGVQIEGFVVDFIQRHPDLADVLEVAKLRGIDRTEAVAIAGHARTRRVRGSMVHWLASLAAD